MRNLGDLNDLYNAQDVIFLCVKLAKVDFNLCMMDTGLTRESVSQLIH